MTTKPLSSPFWGKEMNDSVKKNHFSNRFFTRHLFGRENCWGDISRFRILQMDRSAMISVLVFLCLFSIGQSCKTSTPPVPTPTTIRTTTTSTQEQSRVQIIELCPDKTPKRYMIQEVDSNGWVILQYKSYL